MKQIPLNMPQPQNPPNRETEILRYKFKLNQNPNLELYPEIQRNESFSIWWNLGCIIFSGNCYSILLCQGRFVTNGLEFQNSNALEFWIFRTLTKQQRALHRRWNYDPIKGKQCSTVYMCIYVCVFIYVYVHCFLGITILTKQKSARLYICVLIYLYVNCSLGFTILTKQQSARIIISTTMQ